MLLCAGGASGQENTEPDVAGPDYSPLGPRELQVLQSGSSAGPGAATQTQPAANSLAAPNGTLAETPRRFQYNLSFSERTVFDDNVDVSHTERLSDVYFSLEPTLSLGFGGTDSFTSLSFVYRPTFAFFVDNSNDNSVQHIIRLQGGHSFGHLSLFLSQDVRILDGVDLTTLNDQTGHNANIDVGQRSQHQVYTTNLNGSYDLTGKLFLSSGATFYADQYDGPEFGSENFSGNLFLNYQYREKLVVGVGGTVGYNTVESASPNQLFEQANVRIGYIVTAKISIAATGGFEFRQFEHDSRGLYVSPVYTLNLSYAPFSGTSVGLTGSRQISNSASLGGQDYTSTQIGCSIRQRFLQRCMITLAGGYENANYFSTTSGPSLERDDNYFYVEPSVDVNITRYWTAGAYYLHRQNASSLDPFSFYDNQVGFRTTITF